MDYTQKNLNEPLQRLVKHTEKHYGHNQPVPQQVDSGKTSGFA